MAYPAYPQPTPLPMSPYVRCSVCGGAGRHTRYLLGVARAQHVECLHCYATGWCRCPRCVYARDTEQASVRAGAQAGGAA